MTSQIQGYWLQLVALIGKPNVNKACSNMNQCYETKKECEKLRKIMENWEENFWKLIGKLEGKDPWKHSEASAKRVGNFGNCSFLVLSVKFSHTKN